MGTSAIVDLLENRMISKVNTKAGQKWTVTLNGTQGNVAVVRLVNYFLENAGCHGRIRGAQDKFVWLPGSNESPRIISIQTLVPTLNAAQSIFKFGISYQTVLHITELK